MEIELSEVLAKRHLERQEARVKLDAANGQNVSLKEPKAPPEATFASLLWHESITLYQTAKAGTILVYTWRMHRRTKAVYLPM